MLRSIILRLFHPLYLGVNLWIDILVDSVNFSLHCHFLVINLVAYMSIVCLRLVHTHFASYEVTCFSLFYRRTWWWSREAVHWYKYNYNHRLMYFQLQSEFIEFRDSIPAAIISSRVTPNIPVCPCTILICIWLNALFGIYTSSPGGNRVFPLHGEILSSFAESCLDLYISNVIIYIR